MGMAQRRQGLRVEYLIRDRMRELGYEAHRIPASGAAEGFRGDIECRKDGHEFKIEVKGSKSKFKTLYSMYTKYRVGTPDGVVRVALSDGTLIAFGPSFEDVRKAQDVHFVKTTADNTPPKDLRAFKTIQGLQKLLGECEYLAIKQHNQVILFMRFWGV